MTWVAGGPFVACERVRDRVEALRVVDFGILDSKGRAIGYAVRRYRETITAVERAPGTFGAVCNPENLGAWECASAHVTRDGTAFGASHRDLRARTVDDLEAMISDRIAAARARYALASAPEARA